MSDRSGFRFPRGRNSGFRSRQSMPAASGIGIGEMSCETTPPRVAVTSASAVSPAISLPVSPTNHREKSITEMDGDKCSNKSGSQSIPTKPNCYACKYRREAMGSAHSECVRPMSPTEKMLATLAFATLKRGVKFADFEISGNMHGITNGWFFWPMNFDPVWLDSCSGFEERAP